jgi:hypothetical protein
LAGFIDRSIGEGKLSVRRYIINGALNPGNSGGPLFIDGSSEVVGVVVAKHAPITKFLLSALKALATNKSGMQFTAEDSGGKKIRFSESQVVAELLEHQRKMTQVMLGEAITSSELKASLGEING